MNRCQALVAIGFAFIFLQTLSYHAAAEQEPLPPETVQSVFGSSSEEVETSLYNTLPCSHGGNIYFHGMSWSLSDCWWCMCQNSTVVCSFEGCPIIDCKDGQEPVKQDGECCERCPDPSKTKKIIDDESKVCKYGYSRIPVGESQMVGNCVRCFCQAVNDMKCEIQSCRFFCSNGIKFDDECCPICPYYLPVWQVEPSDMPPISAGKPNNVVFNLVIRSIGGDAIRGDGLLKVSAWAADSVGNRLGYIDQVLSDEQADNAIIRPDSFGAFDFTIDEIEFALNASDATCSQMEYLCVELAKGDNSTMKDPRLPFTLEGVISVRNKSSAPNNLVGCTTFPACKDPGVRHQLSFSVAKKSGQITPVPAALLSWSDVFNNVGGAFNLKTGVFTSYETGSYFFTYQIVETSNALSPQVTLMKNDKVLLTGSLNSNSIIIDLEFGDTVWLQLQGELVGSSERYSTFSGFLI